MGGGFELGGGTTMTGIWGGVNWGGDFNWGGILIGGHHDDCDFGEGGAL